MIMMTITCREHSLIAKLRRIKIYKKINSKQTILKLQSFPWIRIPPRNIFGAFKAESDDIEYPQANSFMNQNTLRIFTLLLSDENVSRPLSCLKLQQ